MFLVRRVGILRVSIPQGSSYNFIAIVRIYNLKPAARGVGAEFLDLAIAQLDEAGGTEIMAEKAPEVVYRLCVTFALQLNYVVEFGILRDLAAQERHAGLEYERGQ